ncbi:hypothetical protein [Amycolatopsis sp. NPDC059021]|uniref:hypothetical protein n=1 Tax=Amycolatopsis sp. NPDC059021 TaxID=3346704 RepID=UPI00366BCDB0
MTARLGSGQAGARITYAHITVDGRLLRREVEEGLEQTEWGPFQAGLFAAVAQDVDPHHQRSNGITLPDGLWVRMADAVEFEPALYPHNPVATIVVTTLAGRSRPCFGAIVILGAEDPETGLTSSLTPGQLAAIHTAHHLAPRCRAHEREAL